MSKQSYWNTDQEYGFNRLACLIYSALVICYLNGIVGICMLFMKDYRSIAISNYNSRTEVWNKEGINEMNNTLFSIKFGGSIYDLKTVRDGFGEYYPYRDRCDLSNEIHCEKSEIAYYQVNIPFTNKTQELTVYNQNVFFNSTIIPNRILHLYKKDINCMGGNIEVCTKECNKYHGIWNTTSNKCHVQMYLQEICLRVLYNNNTKTWNLDNPPQWSLQGQSIQIGCEYSNSKNLYHFIDSSNWLPFNYSFIAPESIQLTIRHYQDPYISASSLTSGCSDRNIENAMCFGHSRHDTVIVSIVFIVIGITGFLLHCTLYLVNLIYRKKGKVVPQWLVSFQCCREYSYMNDYLLDLKEDELKGKSNDDLLDQAETETGEEMSVSVDDYIPVLQMRDEFKDRSYQLGKSIVLRPEVAYSVETPVFEGDEEGI